jgi:6,7-dimethyl-8-ribityllumazine synthase
MSASEREQSTQAEFVRAGAFLEELTDEEKVELSSLRFAVCVGRFYEDLANRLLRGADQGFEIAGVPVPNVTHVSVPGAYELPMAARTLIESGDVAGVACLGVVIRGETDHYDFVCAEAARGIQDVQLETGVPCAFGVITCDSMEQALARAGGDKRDQGRNAALTVARMALLVRRGA